MRRFSKPFPVGDDFFAPLHLPQQRLNGLRTEVHNALNSALAECNKLQTSRETLRMASWPLWKVQAQLEGLSAYARVHDLAPTTSSSRVCGTIQGNYMDIARFFKSETREQYFNVQKRLFPDTIDAAVLHNVPQRTNRPNVSESIKWAAYSPLWRRNTMDGCIFESTGTGVGSDGRSYFYRVVIPATFAEVPELYATKRAVRIQCKSVMIISPSVHDETYSDVFMTMRTDFKDHRVPRGFYKRLVAGIRSVGSLASTHNAPMFMLRQNKWVLRDLQRVCEVCSRDFSMLRTKHQCPLCGEVVCRKCLLQKESGRRSRVPIKGCRSCISRCHEEDAQGTPVLGGGFGTCEEATPTVRTRKEPRFENDWSRKSSDPEWVTTPVSTRTYDMWDRSIDSETEAEDDEIQARISALSSQSFYSISPASSNVGDELCHKNPIYEETECSFDEEDEGEAGVDDDDGVDFSASGSSVCLTIDTREMKRVSSLRDAPDFGPMSPSSSSPSLFQSIGSSLREQSKLLRQLQRVAGSRSVQRNT